MSSPTSSAGLLLARLLGALFVFGGLGMTILVGHRYYRLEYAGSGQKLQLLWEQDVQSLKASGTLPSAWTDIRSIELNAPTDRAKKWLKEIQVPISLNSNGQHKLEVLLLSWEEGSVEGAIVQYNLVNLKDNNMVWELGRTFVLKGDADLTKLNQRESEPSPPKASSPASPQNK